MYNKNPFTLMYGIPATSIISRDDALNTIQNAFLTNDNMYMFLITGIRGTGKTVLLRKAFDIFSLEKNWMAIDINPQGNIIESIANKLVSSAKSQKLLEGWSLSINLPYVTISKDQTKKIDDPEIIIQEILTKFSTHNKKLLITIDEVNNTSELKKFANFYQSLLGSKLPVYLLMTGLKENINSIINDRAMTFLSRAPKIELDPLDMPTIALEYKQIFGIEKTTAIDMAKLTNGYAFAYQVLGYLFYEDDKKILDENFLNKYDSYLWKNGYNKFWNDLTSVEKKFVIALAKAQDGTKEEIIKSFSASSYSQYRKILLEKGLIIQLGYNHLSFVLPRFREFVLYAQDFE
ncbi:MAG: ATP-binding protein [Clostridia bacterium]|nr:ATP-binding protein [Clostridia bacterium]